MSTNLNKGIYFIEMIKCIKQVMKCEKIINVNFEHSCILRNNYLYENILNCSRMGMWIIKYKCNC